MDVEQVVMQWTQQRGKHIAILGSTLGGRGRARDALNKSPFR